MLGAGPEFADRLPVATDQVAKHECQDDRVVELARHRDEVGNEVDGKRKVAHRQREYQLAPARHTRVAQEAPDQYHAVGDETGKRSGLGSAAGEDEEEDGGAPCECESAEQRERPKLPAHEKDINQPGQEVGDVWPGGRRLYAYQSINERREMSKLKNEREVIDAIWADPFRTGNSIYRAEAIRRGDMSALIRLGIRIGP